MHMAPVDAPEGVGGHVMKVLTVFAHNDRHSFGGGVLDRFSAGLADAGHSNDVVDLYAMKFDPVFRDRELASASSRS